jgi:Zn finger protein HypA/HybF involved in hydrogenase expression
MIRVECSRCGYASEEFKSTEAASRAWFRLELPRFQCPKCNSPAATVEDRVLFVEPGDSTVEL